MVLSAVVQLLFLFLLSRSVLLFMDELGQAVAPFYPTSGGINGGFNPPPPAPENPSIVATASHEAEGQPGSSHLAPYQDQGGVGKKKLFTVLNRHLSKYCASPAVTQRFPYLKEEDCDYFAKHIAISELDIEGKPDIEIADLSNYIKDFNRVKTLFDFFFESYYREDD